MVNLAEEHFLFMLRLVRLGGQLLLELRKNTIKRHPLFPLYRLARGLAKLAAILSVGWKGCTKTWAA